MGIQRATVVIIGGGHNGLAMSKRLTDRGIDHVVLEQADVAERRVVQPRQVLPIEHVLPHPLERRGDGAIVGGDRHERHASLVLAAAPLGVNPAA